MSAIISGSVAFDTIMVFPDRFRNHILPEQVHILNVSFLVPQLRREYGGCAGNIAYNLKMLGEEPKTLATVGADIGSYSDWMTSQGIDQKYVYTLNEHYTAQAYITTDMDDNQITAFHPGAMGDAHKVDVPTDAGAQIGVVAPNGPEGMVKHARQMVEAGIPYIFDPGQAMPAFDGDQLREFIDGAAWVAVNDYESRMLMERTNLELEQIAERVEALIVTRGAEGSQIYTQGKTLHIPAAPISQVADPTGCGDAFRAGLLFGLLRGLDWETTGRIASLMGAIKVEQSGTQNHSVTGEEIKQRYQSAFGAPLEVAIGR
ncbi:carbohydrate kinase family protein [Halorhodospira abdelmalekii]|uniref:carbohydrate kinase family protein n=1 Tax=Halorhodospira abdelmalekii TaxID=421629 RepID=UPI0019041637|nr:carbohydrate kinase family protein [Halorhodospira abdelmalekii]MBK1733738.1 carbohydrate kinase family protein [Halorhodospira abdelmalekii]